MPTSSYTFRVTLEGREAVAAAKQLRAELQKELAQGFDFAQAKQQMTGVADMARTTGGHIGAMASEMQGVTKEAGVLEVDLCNADDATRAMISSLLQGEGGARRLEEALQGGKKAAEETKDEVKWLGRTLEEVAQMGQLDRFSAALTAATRQTYGLRMLSSELGRIGVGLMATGMAVVGPEVLAARRWVEYTRDVSYSARAMGLARTESELLRQELIEQSQALALFSPEEMAEGLYLWATGVGATAKTYEDLNKVIQDTVPIQQLAYMQQINLATATENTAGILGEYGLATSDTQRVVEILAATADRTFATVTDLGEAFRMVGPVANQLGVSVEETAASFGILSDANIKGTMAGRAMRQLFIRLTETTAEEDAALNRLFHRSEALDQSWRDLAFPEGKFIGLAKWIDLLAAGTAALTQEERAATLATISTANELPALTQLVERQIAAREQGINVIRAEEKILKGVLDSETEAYARWEESITGNIMGLESAHDGFARKVKQTTEEESFQIDQLKQKWNALMLTMGQAATELALPALEKLDALLDDITEYAAAHPEVVQAAGVAGTLLTGIGAFIKAASTGIRLYTDVKMITAAATMYQASTNMLQAAGIQATSSKNLLAGLGGIGRWLGRGLAAYAGLEVGAWVAGQVRGERVTGGQALGEVGEFLGQLAAMTAGTGGMLTAWLLGEDPAEAFAVATYEAGKLFGLIEEEGADVQKSAEATGEELRDWNVELERARRGVQGLGDDMMQLPTAAGTGLSAFSEEQLKAIDELWEYTFQRNELIESQNQALLDMEADFLEREAELHQDYLDKRAKLEAELRQVVEEPLWMETKEVQRAKEREAEAIEEYNERIQEAIADHQKRLRDLKEDHDEKMEDLEAQRDAKGILAERRRYSRAVRDANEQHRETMGDLKERLDETLEEEREKIATLREERKADLEEKLKELAESYAEEARRRKEDFDKRYTEKQLQNQQELRQLELALAKRMASIMGWEERLRQALREKYVGREADLRAHLANLERMYLESYNMLSQLSPEAMTPEEYRAYHEVIRGHQAGGYAPYGLYRLGEAGREFVLSASTTRALERAIGPITQAKLLAAGGGGTSRMEFSINVQTDGTLLAAEIRSDIRHEIVKMFSHAANANPRAHRSH